MTRRGGEALGFDLMDFFLSSSLTLSLFYISSYSRLVGGLGCLIGAGFSLLQSSILFLGAFFLLS
ncbi:hypothetical protein V8C35DRAFT_238101 [Trichoderma chlorosporum]